MNILYIDEKHRQAYDHFIQSMSQGSFRQGYAWGDVMSYDNDIIRLAVERDGTLIAAISLQRKKLPCTPFSFLYSPRGPILDYDDHEAFALLMKEVATVARKGNSIFLRIDPDFLDEDHHRRQRLEQNGFKYLVGKDWSYFNYPRVLMRLDTIPPEETLRQNLRKKHRQHINNFATKGGLIHEADDEAGLKEFYGLMTELSIRKGFPVRSYEYYQKLRSGFGEDIKILLARHEGQLLAGVMSLMYGNKCWYMHGATVEGKGNLHPAEGLHWEMVRWAQNRGGIFYDLGGTGTEYPPKEDNPNYPLYHFKKGFNAEIAYLTGYYDMVFNPFFYMGFRGMEEHGLPLAMKMHNKYKLKFSHHE